jgi:hypothetical protein
VINKLTLIHLLQRIYAALALGGMFIFDLAEPGQVNADGPIQRLTEGEDWLVLVTKEEDRSQATLTRRIITFRQIGEHYRREEEIHQLQLYKAAEVAEGLEQVGFQVQVMQGYGQFNLPLAHAALIARKSLDDRN